jgi:hypothetical protein
VSLIAQTRRIIAPLLSALAPLLFALGFVIVNITEQASVDAETREAISELVRRGYELEKRGRELAYASKGLVSWGVDEAWLRELNLWYGNTLMTLHKLRWRLGMAEVKSNLLANAAEAVDRGRYATMNASDLVVEALNKYRIVSREAKIVEISAKISALVKETLENMSRAVNSVTGSPCLWILGKLKPLEEYTVATMYNDLTACHHRILDYLSLIVDPETTRVSERVFSSRGNPTLVDGCLKWERVLSELRMHGLVDPSDYHPTVCMVTGDSASVRVGTMVSHTTHVELVNGIIRALYYDVDESVHTEVAKLAEKLGIRVVEHRPSDFTVLELPVDRKDLLFKRLLPFISSMDERIRRPEMWRVLYYDKAKEELERIGEAELAYRAPEEFKRRFDVELDC